MARLLILRFEDDQVAEGFIGWQKYQSNIVSMATVEGMFQTPTQFCDCAYRGDGWRHSGKHNWWLHHSCGRPSVGWGNNIRTIISSGHDLLEKLSKNTQERIDAAGRKCPECGQAREGYE